MSTPDEAVARARAAAPDWAARPLEERVVSIRRFGELVRHDADALARLLTDEMGKPITQSRNELAGVLPRVDYFVEQVPQVLRPTTVYDDGEIVEQVSYEPLGVVANISAWNYPWFVGVNVLLPALLTGNAVLYKPSELVPGTGAAIVELFHRAGVPEEVLALVPGGPEGGAALLEQPVDGVFFTGSYTTGRRIAEAVAGRMVRLQLELGGKDPVYVTDDVDVEQAAASLADGAFYNNGQSCCSVERIYVHQVIYERFVDAFVDAVEGFVVGDPHDERTYLGPLARPQQLEVLEAQVADALAKGAVLRTGGHRLTDRPGAWFAPTVLADATNDMTVMREESFGPIVGIGAVTGDEQAVALMNDTDYGLTAGVYTRDGRRARQLLAQLDAGSAYWNCCDRVSPRLPWSGRRHSGVGSTLGTAGILAFVQPKAWHLRG
ncbi:MAG: aldehyde dehydrogenase family protein [Acidimicrobiales bacterium]